MVIQIKNGHVIDPSTGTDEIKDIWIKGNFIADENTIEKNTEKITVFNAEGYYVFPGLIDFHTHLFYTGSGLGINPQLLLATGVTTAVDAGTAGCANFEAFYNSVIVPSEMDIKALINIGSSGILGCGIDEDLTPKMFRREEIIELCQKYKDVIIGLKMRMSEGCIHDNGIIPLIEAKALSEELGLPLVVHTTETNVDVDKIVNELQTGDIFCHVYQGSKHNIIKNGKVSKAIIDARKRGVLFDDAHGYINYSIDVAKTALAEGFFPDFISTDHTTLTLFRDGFAKTLPHIMTEYLEFGMNLYDVVKLVTVAPAKFLGMDKKIGTLAPNAYADVSVFKLIKDKETYHCDLTKSFIGHNILSNQLTLRKGKVVYRSDTF